MDVPRGGLVAELGPLRRPQRLYPLPTVAFLAALGLAGVSLATFGADTAGLKHALAITARFSYLWFWPAYAGSALAVTLGRKFSLGRACGLAFVAAHSVHLLLVIWLYRLSPTPPISFHDAVFFSVGIGFMYLLALLSIKKIAGMLYPWLWRLLLLIGMEYIEFAFLSDFWVNPLHPISLKLMILYVPFMLLGLFGTLLRLSRLGVFVLRIRQILDQRMSHSGIV